MHWGKPSFEKVSPNTPFQELADKFLIGFIESVLDPCGFPQGFVFF